MIEGSMCFEGDLRDWEAIRSFISNAVYKSGTFLDVGCANGFFLRCMQEWCVPHRLIPFGVDINEDLICRARTLFIEQPDHFVNTNGLSLQFTLRFGWPGKFAYVYCSLLSPAEDRRLDNEVFNGLLKTLYDLVEPRGRLILGLYGSASHDQEHLNAMILLRKQSDRIARHFPLCGYLENPQGSNQIIIWIDKDT